MSTQAISLLEYQFIDIIFITRLTGLSDKWFYKLIQDGEFPKPIKLGRSSHRLKSEVGGWLQYVLRLLSLNITLLPFLHEQHRHETLLRHYQHWLDGLTKLAVAQGMCHPFIKNSHQLMVAYIHFPETR